MCIESGLIFWISEISLFAGSLQEDIQLHEEMG